MNDRDVTEVIGAVGIFGMISVVVTIVVWNMAATWRARATLARDHEYRTLADQAVQQQEALQRQLADIVDRITDLQDRVRSMERIIKEIE
ncbi:hypothetical protein [Streptomyces sp. B6B3]|uniref:hypothetical protein n=1 Tax=Streptomyces sp. B6B3 TaxID=3153570 RepID=UPI00325E1561